MTNKNSSLRCIVVLVCIAIVCVALLAVLNDILYVPPDVSVFTKAADGEYDVVKVEEAPLTYGKVEVVVEGKTLSGQEVVGFYTTGNKFGKADSFQIAVIVDKNSDQIVGLYEILDGSTGGFAWDESLLNSAIGSNIVKIYDNENANLVQTGTTNSSWAVRYAIYTAAEYYEAVYNN